MIGRYGGAEVTRVVLRPQNRVAGFLQENFNLEGGYSPFPVILSLCGVKIRL